ncbi:MFS transporter [Thermopolyspora sp. NPDC052614]|uniref:MFS transporter n=1 Tax=Thermopolyspora sp. NPDC052614 TaxID=3155682 RepID=UPI003432DB44
MLPGGQQVVLGRRWWLPVTVSYVAFIITGVGAAATGVLLPAQIRDYGVDMATIGTTFFAFSAGFMLAGSTAGPVIHRFGIRAALVIGGGVYVAACLYTALRPPFLAFVAVQVVVGHGMGTLESALNTFLAGLPNSTTLLNRLHAFFGVGALIGPLLATWILGFAPWTMVSLVLAVATVPVLVAFVLTLPARPAPAAEAAPDRTPEAAPKPGEKGGGSLLGAVAREPAVLLGAAFLAVYVGTEISVGNWAFTFLTEERELTDRFAGYIVSGYWLGLTAGRFLISPLATRLGLTPIGMTFLCLFGVTTAALLTWVFPGTIMAAASLTLFGFFLGPLFPTTMAVAPQLASPALVPTTIGLLNGVSVIGGAVFPWLVGAIAEGIGVWTLPPYALTLAFLQLTLWWAVANRLSPTPALPTTP